MDLESWIMYRCFVGLDITLFFSIIKPSCRNVALFLLKHPTFHTFWCCVVRAQALTIAVANVYGIIVSALHSFIDREEQ
jgi:hypothetical protein